MIFSRPNQIRNGKIRLQRSEPSDFKIEPFPCMQSCFDWLSIKPSLVMKVKSIPFTFLIGLLPEILILLSHGADSLRKQGKIKIRLLFFSRSVSFSQQWYLSVLWNYDFFWYLIFICNVHAIQFSLWFFPDRIRSGMEKSDSREQRYKRRQDKQKWSVVEKRRCWRRFWR